jgi:lambda repressor-like predicted transcriptional regulator
MANDKYTPERVEIIRQAIELGTTYRLAAQAAGINENTFKNWKRDYPEFEEIVAMAEGKAAMRWLARIEQAAADGVWQAAAWKLERRYPHSYGRKVIEHDRTEDYVIDLGLTSHQALNDDGAATPLLDKPSEV